jgi:RNA-directed DNA polymerase
MHAPIAQVGEWLRSVLRGYYQYHAVPGNLSILSLFRYQVARLWFRTLSQRSQRRPTWKKLGPVFNHWLPSPRCMHPFPNARFDARRLAASHPR